MESLYRTLLRGLLLTALAAPWGAHANTPPTAQGQTAGRENRIALVIGNNSYSIGSLKNPVSDARAVAGTLRDLGFQVVLKEDAGFQTMLGAIRDFSLHAKDSDVRLFYYAGHGMQVNGRNYLIPVDIQPAAEDDILARSVDLSELVNKLGLANSGLNIIVLDACRNNPFSNPTLVGTNGRLAKFRGLTHKGLAEVSAPAGTLVEFATAPGDIALDGGEAAHSLYTKHLLQHIAVSGLPVEQVFKRVRIAVARETNGRQMPWESSSLLGDFCFRKAANGQCPFEPGREDDNFGGRSQR